MLTRKFVCTLWIVAFALLLVTGGYIGTYYTLVQPDVFLHDSGVWSWQPLYYWKMAGVDAEEPFGLDWHWRICRFFWPIHRIDRSIRPHVWEEDPYMSGNFDPSVAP